MKKNLLIIILILIQISVLIILCNNQKIENYYAEKNYTEYLSIKEELERNKNPLWVKPEITETLGKQLFFGKWKVAERMPLGDDCFFPSSYGRYYEKYDAFIFKDSEKFTLGREITYTMDYMEFEGKKHYYASELKYSPVYYMKGYLTANCNIDDLGLSDNGTMIGVYTDIIKSYEYPDYVYNENMTEEEFRDDRALKIEELSSVYVKDKNTIFISDGVSTFRLERIE